MQADQKAAAQKLKARLADSCKREVHMLLSHHIDRILHDQDLLKQAERAKQVKAAQVAEEARQAELKRQEAESAEEERRAEQAREQERARTKQLELVRAERQKAQQRRIKREEQMLEQAKFEAANRRQRLAKLKLAAQAAEQPVIERNLTYYEEESPQKHAGTGLGPTSSKQKQQQPPQASLQPEELNPSQAYLPSPSMADADPEHYSSVNPLLCVPPLISIKARSSELPDELLQSVSPLIPNRKRSTEEERGSLRLGFTPEVLASGPPQACAPENLPMEEPIPDQPLQTSHSGGGKTSETPSAAPGQEGTQQTSVLPSLRKQELPEGTEDVTTCATHLQDPSLGGRLAHVHIQAAPQDSASNHSAQDPGPLQQPAADAEALPIAETRRVEREARRQAERDERKLRQQVIREMRM